MVEAMDQLQVKDEWNIAFTTMISQQPKLIGIAADHGGFELKQILTARLRGTGHSVVDFCDRTELSTDDYPDFVIPLARAVANGEVQRGIAICGSGVGAAVAANSVNGVRAMLAKVYNRQASTNT
jgi:RpiB/LacA/LacB family sugar-phosphate isomerase